MKPLTIKDQVSYIEKRLDQVNRALDNLVAPNSVFEDLLKEQFSLSSVLSTLRAVSNG